jgi:hypothetical protein
LCGLRTERCSKSRALIFQGFTPQMWNNSQAAQIDSISSTEEDLIVKVLSEALRSGRNYWEALNHLDRVSVLGPWRFFFAAFTDQD